MLSKNTWGEFLITVIILISLYYLAVGVRFYLPQIKKILSGRKEIQSNDAIYNDGDAVLNELEDVTRDLRYAVLERLSHPVSKEQLLELLQRRLAGYSGLSKPAFRVALNNYIMLHAKEICDISVNEQELNARWDEVI